MKNKLYIILAFISVVFGVMTIRTGGLFLFTEEGQVAAGNYVPFVLWFNFIAGFFYVVTGVGIALKKAWSLKASRALAILTGVVFIAFGGHVFFGGAYEVRTFGAMTFRTLFWVVISLLLSIKTMGYNLKAGVQ